MDRELAEVMAILGEMSHLAYGTDPDAELVCDSMDVIRLIVTLEQRLGVLISEQLIRKTGPGTARQWADIARSSPTVGV